MSVVSNIVKVGIVSSVDVGQNRIRATFPDRDNQVSGWLQLVKQPISSVVQMPTVGEMVLCVFLGNGLEKGYWLGVIES